MEAVYYYEDKNKKDVETLLSDEFFKRLGPIDREAKLMGTQRKTGYYLYINADNPDKYKMAQDKIAESKIEMTKLSGDEEKAVIDCSPQGRGRGRRGHGRYLRISTGLEGIKKARLWQSLIAPGAARVRIRDRALPGFLFNSNDVGFFLFGPDHFLDFQSLAFEQR